MPAPGPEGRKDEAKMLPLDMRELKEQGGGRDPGDGADAGNDSLHAANGFWAGQQLQYEWPPRAPIAWHSAEKGVLPLSAKE